MDHSSTGELAPLFALMLASAPIRCFDVAEQFVVHRVSFLRPLRPRFFTTAFAWRTAEPSLPPRRKTEFATSFHCRWDFALLAFLVWRLASLDDHGGILRTSCSRT